MTGLEPRTSRDGSNCYTTAQNGFFGRLFICKNDKF